MAKKTNNKQHQKNLKIAGIVAGVALVVGLGIYYRSYKQEQDSKTAAVAQEQKKDQGDSTKSSTSSGGVVDNNASSGSSSSTPPTPPADTSGPITITTPADGALITNGGSLSGTASVATVQYRFKDGDGLDVATGALTVAGGKYSGSVMGLSARTATGTLEVYNYNANGAEENWVKINVRYK